MKAFSLKDDARTLPYFTGIPLACLIFYIDHLVELGVAGGVPYVAVILIGFWSRRSSVVVQFAVLCAVLTLLGWYFSPPGGEAWKVASNRLLALFAIGVTALLCIHAQKRNDQMEESKADLDAIFHTVPAMIWYKDAHNRLIRVNKFTEKITGVPVQDMEGRPMEEFFPDMAESCHLGDLQVIKTGKPLDEVVAEVKTATGTHWLQVDKVPYRRKKGGIEGVIVFAVDITESRKAQEQLLLLFTAIEQGQTAVMITDDEGIIKYVNPSFCQNSGYRVDELVGQKPSILKSGAHEDKFYAELWKTLRAGKIWRGEIINQAKNGVRYADRVAIHPIWDRNEQVSHFVWIRNDDVQHQEALDQLRQYARELAHSNKELEAFASIASHDIQEPLRKIISFGDKLLSDYKPVLDERGRNYLERMIQASDRLQCLVRDLIDLACVTGNVQTVTQVDLNALLDEVMVDLEFTIEEKEAVIERSSLPVIEGNRTQLHQLFQNLLSNAMKFHKKEIPPRVVVSCKELENGEYEIKFADNGIGFEEKYLERVFKPFERLHSLLTGYSGSGIGLALCKKIVEAHGGAIRAQSQPGGGSTFIVRLPAVQVFSKHQPSDLL